MSRHSLKFSTDKKKNLLEDLFSVYKIDLQYYIDLLWDGKLELSKNLSSKVLPINNIEHSRWRQNIYKQASEIVRSCRKRKKKSKPEIKEITINLDERFFDIKEVNSNEFAQYIKIIFPFFKEGKRRTIQAKYPIKQHKHSLKFSNWQRANTVQLKKTNNQFYLNFIYKKEIELKSKKKETSIAFDAGYKKMLVDHKGNAIGVEINDLYKKISNKQQGSKSFEKALRERNSRINEELNKFDLSQISHVVIERLKSVHKNKRKDKKRTRKQMNKQQRWVYSYISNKLERLCEENGVCLTKVNPAYTSQTCSFCGNIDKSSRKGEIYHCKKCKIKMDADHNAAINIFHRGVYGPSEQEKSKICINFV